MLTHFELAGVRNLHPVELDLHPNLNVIYGQNASGKTSLLEAIAILASGKSFRTHSLENVVQHGSDYLQLFCKTQSGDRFGYRWGRDSREIRINGENVNRVSLLAQALPLQSFTPETHIEFSRSRRHRIAILDWILFHVEQGFHDTWSRYQRVLSQRNAALKKGQNQGIWDKDLIRLGESIVTHRKTMLEWLKPQLQNFATAIPGGGDITIKLKKGWAQEKTLAQSLEDDTERDRRDGYTHSGAHRSDLDIKIDGRKAKEEASQGQLKTLVMALRLSQINIFIEQTGKQCIFLLDDLPAELDQVRRSKVLSVLSALPLQIFITTTEPGLIDLRGWPTGYTLFHVERGQVTRET